MSMDVIIAEHCSLVLILFWQMSEVAKNSLPYDAFGFTAKGIRLIPNCSGQSSCFLL